MLTTTTPPPAENAQPAPIAPAPQAPAEPQKPTLSIAEFLAREVSKNSVSQNAAGSANPTPDPAPAAPESLADAGAAPSAAPPEPASGAQESAQGQPSQPEKTAFMKYLEHRGFQNVRSDEEGYQRLMEYEKIANAAQGRAVPEPQQPAEPRGYSAPAAQPPAAPQESSKPVPFNMDQLELSPEEESLVSEYQEVGDDGKARWTSDAPIELRKRVEQVHRNRQTFSKALLTKPMEVFKAISEMMVQPMVKEQVQTIVQQTTRQQEEQRVLKSVVDSNPWMLQVDPRTNQPMLDPRDGLPMFSQAGDRVFAQVDHLTSKGLSVAEAMDIAVVMAQREFGYQNQQPAPPPKPSINELEEQRKAQQQALLRGATAPIPNGQGAYRNGTEPTQNGEYRRNPDGTVSNAPPRSQNPNAGLGSALFDRLGMMKSTRF